MKLAVCILSRGNPEALTGVIMGLWRLRSEKHEVRFVLGIDDDDIATHEAASRLTDAGPVLFWPQHRKRPVSRGEVENALIKEFDSADAVTLLTDRTFCITPGWDDFLARGVIEKPTRLLWWSCPNDNMCVMPVISKQWLEACNYEWSPEIFPFWFDDTWNQHIELMIHGMPSQKVKASYAGIRGKTTRGRDFAFWINVFNQTLPIRVQKAKEMALRLGVEWQTRPDVMKYLEDYAKGMAANAETFQKTFGDDSDPGLEYTIAKERAEKMLAEMSAIREAAQ